MKKCHLLYVLCLLTLTTACQTKPYSDDVICESYTHRYGVPLKPEEWSERGRYGQVCSTRRDGVVVTRGYAAGQLQGECSYTFPHSSLIQKKEMYEANRLTSEVYYYPNGLPQKQVDYNSNGSKTLTKWFDNGSPQRKETYVQGTLWEGEYFNLNSQVESRVEDGNGIRTRRDNYGQLLSTDDIQNGQMATRRAFHANGVPASLTPYQNGVIQGQRSTFAMSGEPLTVESWNNDFQDGVTVSYQNGERYSELPYVKGSRQGVEKRYRDGSNLVQEVTWVDDQQHGITVSYFGNTKQTDWYFEGRHVNKQTFDVLSKQ